MTPSVLTGRRLCSQSPYQDGDAHPVLAGYPGDRLAQPECSQPSLASTRPTEAAELPGGASEKGGKDPKREGDHIEDEPQDHHDYGEDGRQHIRALPTCTVLELILLPEGRSPVELTQAVTISSEPS